VVLRKRRRDNNPAREERRTTTMRITTHGSPTFRDVRRGLRMPLRAIIRSGREHLARETPNFPLPCQGKSAVIRQGSRMPAAAPRRVTSQESTRMPMAPSRPSTAAELPAGEEALGQHGVHTFHRVDELSNPEVHSQACKHVGLLGLDPLFLSEVFDHFS
jgi:hypothetical protein